MQNLPQLLLQRSSLLSFDFQEPYSSNEKDVLNTPFSFAFSCKEALYCRRLCFCFCVLRLCLWVRRLCLWVRRRPPIGRVPSAISALAAFVLAAFLLLPIGALVHLLGPIRNNAPRLCKPVTGDVINEAIKSAVRSKLLSDKFLYCKSNILLISSGTEPILVLIDVTASSNATSVFSPLFNALYAAAYAIS